MFYNDYDTYFSVDDELALISYINEGEEAKICGGIGMQSHVDIKRPTLEEYGNALKMHLLMQDSKFRLRSLILRLILIRTKPMEERRHMLIKMKRKLKLTRLPLQKILLSRLWIFRKTVTRP